MAVSYTHLDVYKRQDLLRRKVVNAQAELPEGANPSIVKDDFGNVYGMFRCV